MPEALRAGGLAESALAHAERVQATGAERELLDQLRNDFRLIRQEYEDPQARFAAAPTTREGRYIQALTEHEHIYNASPVFRFALASHKNLKVAVDSLWNAACRDYMAKPDIYDRVLGEFIPRDLRDRVRNHIALNAYTAGTNVTAAEDWEVYRRRLRVRRNQQTLGLLTGLTQLDRLTGGLPRLTFLGGGTGVGKSSLALSMALGVLHAHPDVAVLYYSLDLPKDLIYDRLLCQQSGLDYHDVWCNDDDPEVTGLLSEAQRALVATVLPRLRIMERKQLGQGKEAVLGTLLKRREELVQGSGAKRALHILDYFQLLDVADNVNTTIEADAQRIALLQTVQTVTCTHQSPSGDSFLILSEVRKGEHGRPRLALDDLLGSVRIAYSADCVLLLEADGEATDSAADTAPLLLTVAKGRDGMRRGKLSLALEYMRHRFRETTPPPLGRTRASGGRAGTSSPPSHVANPLAGGQGG